MTKERALAVAAELQVGLHSPGVCPACISFVAYEIEGGNERRVAGQITSFAPLLWDEGLGDVVRAELGRQSSLGNEAAAEAMEELAVSVTAVRSSVRWCAVLQLSSRRG
jgi:hypothetical protein